MAWVLLLASAQASGSMFDFQSTIVIGERPFQLVGRTQFVAGYFFKVYEAGLYLDQAPVSEENIVEKPLYLELVYSLLSLSLESFCPRSKASAMHLMLRRSIAVTRMSGWATGMGLALFLGKA